MPPPSPRFRYTGLEVRNLERSLRFYVGLGFREIGRGRMEHGGEWIQMRLTRQRQRLELNFYPPGNPHRRRYRTGSELDHLGFSTPDPEAWGRKVRQLGGRGVSRIRETNQWLVYATDPDGVWLEFFGPPKRRRQVRRRSRLASG